MEELKFTDGIQPIELIDTTNMSEEEWLATREHGIGKDPSDKDYIPYTVTGSGAASAIGISPYVSDVEYRDKKMGAKPKVEVNFNEESKRAGHVFEPFVAINFLRYMKFNFPEVKINLIKDCMRDILPYLYNTCPDKAGYKEFCDSQEKVIQSFKKKWKLNPSSMYQCGTKNPDGTLKYPWALANIDGLLEVNGQLGIFEAKTTSSISARDDYWQKGIIPPHYYWQLVFYMAVMNLNFAYITCCWGFTLNDMAVILLERDRKVEEEFMEELAKFIDDMAEEKPLEKSKSDPELVANWYERKYGKSENTFEVAELPPQYQNVIAEAIELDGEIARAEEALETITKRKQELLNEIRPVMGERIYAKIEMPDKKIFRIKITQSMHRAKFREADFISDHPELVDDFTKKSIDTAKMKKDPKYSSLVAQYTDDPTLNENGKCSYKITEYSEEAADVDI